jgi:hypothetical protein
MPCYASATAFEPVPDFMRCKYWGDAPIDGAKAIEYLSMKVSRNFRMNDNILERDVNEWNSPSCVFEDGTPVIAALNGGFQRLFTTGWDWTESLTQVEFVKTNFPDTGFAALAEAAYWKHYAWYERGNGFASSVKPESLKIFNERLEKAEKVLTDSKPYAAELPNWYAEMITVQSQLNRSEAEREQTFLEGTNKFKTYYPIYYAMLNSQLPKWGGSWLSVDNTINLSVENTKISDRNAMYARLYSSVYVNLLPDESFFKVTLVSWPKLKQGYEDMIIQYPKSNYNLNRFAMFACKAEDKDTFLSLRNKIGKNIMFEAWVQNPNLLPPVGKPILNPMPNRSRINPSNVGQLYLPSIIYSEPTESLGQKSLNLCESRFGYSK